MDPLRESKWTQKTLAIPRIPAHHRFPGKILSDKHPRFSAPAGTRFLTVPKKIKYFFKFGFID